ncbi:MAG: glycine zipper protein [Ramlibacter sp.]|nr:glycine zipper protein [Ramlibacter sp.]
MKKAVLFSAMGMLASFANMAGAQEVGRVLSSTPVVQQVPVQRQVCSAQPMAVQQPNSGGGGVIGALAGGAIGNQMGHGDGRAAATIIGLVGGALLGNRIESNNSAAQVQNVQQCGTQTVYENRTVGYNVAYEYAGKQYNVQMPYDPGQTIRLQLTPVGGAAAAPSGPGPAQSVIVAPPVGQTAVQTTVDPAMQPQGQAVAQIIAAPAMYPGPAVYPGYYAPAYYSPYYRPYFYPPIGLSLSFGYSHGYGHRHWR